jgi:CshA-type fibril repeat protein
VGSFAVVDDQIRFTGAPTFTGTATTTYTVRDENGTPATGKLTVTVEAVTPTAADDTASVRQGGTVTTDVLENDAAGDPEVPLDPSSVTVADGEQDGVGTFDVVDGRIRFVGDRAFTGTAMVRYTVRDANGTPVSAVLAVDVIAVTPTAMPDAVATEQSDAVRVPVLDNDAAGDPDVPLDPATLAFVQDGTPTDTVTEPGVGSWKTEDGGIVFVPEPGFSGVATTGYRVADTNGTLAESTVTVTVTAVVPVATADEATTDQGVARTVDVLDNDRAGRAATPLDPETLALVAPTAAAGTARVVGDDVPELRFDGQGTWTVTDDHRIRFAPAVSFTGTAHATYAVQDANGTRVTAAVTVDVRPAVLDLHRDEVRGTQGDRLTVRPLENDRAPRGGELDPETLRLSAPDDVRGAIVAADGHSVTVPGEGRWTVDTASAEVTFQPEPDFIGEAHPIPYTIANVHGVTGSSQITATLDAAPAELAFTGATLPLGALLAAALMTGLGVLLHRRRRA